jgi:hypothetical protein
MQGRNQRTQHLHLFLLQGMRRKVGRRPGPDSSARGSRKTEEGKGEPGMMIDKVLVDKLRQTGISV